MPLCVNALDPRSLETKGNHLFKKKLNEPGIFPLKYLCSQGIYALKGGPWKLAYLLLKERKALGNNLSQLIKICSLYKAYKILVQLPKDLFVDDVKSLHLHHMKEEKEMDGNAVNVLPLALLEREPAGRLSKGPCYLLIPFYNVHVARKFGKCQGSLLGIIIGFFYLFGPFNQGLEGGVADGLKKRHDALVVLLIYPEAILGETRF